MSDRLGGIIKSFGSAFSGLWLCVRRERNLRVHMCALAAVVWLSCAMGVSRAERALLIVTCTMVISAELLNTSIEYVVDSFTHKYSLPAKYAKDIAAGAVLCTAVGALLCGICVFWRPAELAALLAQISSSPAYIAALLLFVLAAALFILLPGSKKHP